MNKRIKEAREALKITQTDLGDRVGVTTQAVQQWESGKTSPRGKRIEMLASTLNVSAEWLQFGGNNSQTLESNSSEFYIPVVPNEDFQGDLSAYTEIDVYDVKLSAGNGNLVTWEARKDEPLLFRTAWFKRHMLSRESIKAMYVKGDSMEPILYNWDTILIDIDDVELVSGSVYAVIFNGKQFIKEIRVRHDGIELISYNSKYAPMIIPDAEAEKFIVLGRMVWRGGNI